MRPIWWIILLVACAFGAWQHFAPRFFPGPLPLDNSDFTITKVQPYRLEALVMSSRNYLRSEGGEVMPVDLALAWGGMADPEKIGMLSVQQRDRFYFWQADHAALNQLGRANIESQTANIHCVPGNEAVREALYSVRKGDWVKMKGWLVDIRGPDREWRTSRSRTDTGPGACEIILVDELEIGEG